MIHIWKKYIYVGLGITTLMKNYIVALSKNQYERYKDGIELEIGVGLRKYKTKAEVIDDEFKLLSLPIEAINFINDKNYIIEAIDEEMGNALTALENDKRALDNHFVINFVGENKECLNILEKLKTIMELRYEESKDILQTSDETIIIMFNVESEFERKIILNASDFVKMNPQEIYDCALTICFDYFGITSYIKRHREECGTRKPSFPLNSIKLLSKRYGKYFL